MSNIPERNLEIMLRGVAFSNPAHKEALRERLFGDEAELELDDLALVAGGLAEPFVPLEAWPDKEMRHA